MPKELFNAIIIHLWVSVKRIAFSFKFVLQLKTISYLNATSKTTTMPIVTTRAAARLPITTWFDELLPAT